MMDGGGVRRGRLAVLRGDGLAPLRGAEVADGYAQTVGTLDEVYVDAEGTPMIIGIGVPGEGLVLVAAETAEVLLLDRGVLVALPYSASQLRGVRPAHDPDASLQRDLDVRGLYRAWDGQEIVDERQSTPAPTPLIAERDDLEGTPEALRAGDPDTRQTQPAPTPEIAMAEVEDAIARGEDPGEVRTRRWGT